MWIFFSVCQIYLISFSFRICLTSTVALNEDDDKVVKSENTPETSSEILDDVLKQLDKLSISKRKQILKKLSVSNLITDLNVENTEKTTNISPKLKPMSKTKHSPEIEPIQDEVEILDLHEPKMGTYKRKRSKSLQHNQIFLNQISADYNDD